MSFFKTAKTEVLAYNQLGAGFGHFTQSKTASAKKIASFYNEGPLTGDDIQKKLEAVASAYCISAKPTDYVYVAVRALTADLPNENFDAFSEKELVRFEPKHGCKVYQTFILKPHHVNHRSADATQARGVILDAHYNTKNEQHFPEILIAVDKTKDKRLAEGIASGDIAGFSMGCTADWTLCSICNHKASSPSDFCNHIKFYKGKEVEGKVAFEWCEGVTFEEESSVDDPADKNALTQEVILASKKKELEIESDLLAISTKLNSLNTNVTKIMSKLETKEGANMATENKKVASTEKLSEEVKNQEVKSAEEVKPEVKAEEMKAEEIPGKDKEEKELEDYKEEKKEEKEKQMTGAEYGVSPELTEASKKENPYSKLIAERNKKQAVDSSAKEYWDKYQGDYGKERVKDIKKKKVKADSGQSWKGLAKGGNPPAEFKIDKKTGNPPAEWKFAQVYKDVEVHPGSRFWLVSKSKRPVYAIIAPEVKDKTASADDVTKKIAFEILEAIAKEGLVAAMKNYKATKLQALYTPTVKPSLVEEFSGDLRDKKVRTKPTEGINDDGKTDLSKVDKGKPREKALSEDGVNTIHLSNLQKRAEDLDHLKKLMEKEQSEGKTDEQIMDMAKSYLETQASKEVKAEPAKLTPEANEFISKKIEKLVNEGKEQEQAIAIAYQMAREQGFDVPEAPKQSAYASKEAGVTDRVLKDLAGFEKMSPEEKKGIHSESLDDLADVKRDTQKADEIYAGGKDDLNIQRKNVVDLKASKDDKTATEHKEVEVNEKNWKEVSPKKWEQIQKAAVEKVRKESQKEVAEFKTSFRQRFVRALNLAAKRANLNIVENQIKIALADTLLTPTEEYTGMDVGLATELIESAFNQAGDAFIASLLKEADKFVDMPEESFLAIEDDTNKLNLVLPIADVSESAPGEEFEVGPMPPEEGLEEPSELVEKASSANPIFAPKDGSIGKFESLKGIFRERLI